jgi:hemolysin activation/secretion protein
MRYFIANGLLNKPAIYSKTLFLMHKIINSGRFQRRWIFIFLLVFLQAGSAFAQQDVPAGADPSRFRQQLPTSQSDTQPLQSPQLPQSDDFVSEAPAGAEGYQFFLNAVEIQGSTVWTAEELQNMAADMIGKTVSVADIFTLSEKITQKYQTAGYFLSRAVVPEQEIDGGIVKIAIVEGYVLDVTFDDKRYPAHLESGVQTRITSFKPLNIRELEFQLLVLDDVPGCGVNSILLPLSQDEAAAYPGGVRLSISFRCDEVKYMASFDNYGSKFVGPWQSGASTVIRHGGVLPGTLSAGVFISPQIKEMRYVSLEEAMHISSSGLIMKTGLQMSWSEPGSDLKLLDLYSRFFAASVAFEYPLILKRSERFHINAGLEYKNIESEIISSRFYDDRLRVFSTGFSYDRSFDSGTFAQLNANFYRGFDIMGARETGSIDLSRLEGRSNFAKTDFSASVFQSLPRYFGLNLSVSGQYSFVPLLSSEEFGYGGYNLGRGYDNSEITGDSGVGVLSELSWNRYANYGGDLADPSVQPFVYFDAGKVWNEDTGGAPESGVSAGFGLRLGWGEKAQISGTLAQPLTRRVENPAYGNGHNPRFLLSANISF